MSGSDAPRSARDDASTMPGAEQPCVVDIHGLKKYFSIRGGLSSLWKKSDAQVRAVDDVSFHIAKGEIVGLVGETGCGKTTVGRLIVRLDDPTGGTVKFEGVDIASLKSRQVKKFRKRAQMIFQDPYASLNPRMTVTQIVSEPLLNYGFARDPEVIAERVSKALGDAGLRPIDEYLERFPHELSGGERQRVSVARALVMDPVFIVADEPVSMLDVSIRAGVMNLMLELRRKYGIAYLFITHDISVARYMCDRIAIMYLGKIMELADSETIIYAGMHPYTRALLKAVPVADPTRERAPLPIKGEIPSPIDRPSGCVFRTRCPFFYRDCIDRFAFRLDVGLRGAIEEEKPDIDDKVAAEFKKNDRQLSKAATKPVMKRKPIGAIPAIDVGELRPGPLSAALKEALQKLGVAPSGNASLIRVRERTWDLVDESARFWIVVEGDQLNVSPKPYWDVVDTANRYRFEDNGTDIKVMEEVVPIVEIKPGQQVACIRVQRGEI